jgi:hypothetical protein
MKTLLLFAILAIFLLSCGNPKTEIVKITSSKIDTGALPKTIKYKGSIDTAVKYTDSEGEHIIVTTEDDDIEKSDDGNNRLTGIYLYAYCYKLIGDKWKLLWQARNFTNECDLDISGSFVPNTFAVTDLDQNGKAEVWLMYSLACRGGVDPSDLKVIMHEGDKKYAMRGGSRVKVNATDYAGGDYKFDPAFKSAPLVFRQHAQSLWEKHKNETFGEDHPNGIVK